MLGQPSNRVFGDKILINSLGVAKNLDFKGLFRTLPDDFGRSLELGKVISYLCRHPYQPMTVKDILRAVAMTRRIMERRFRQEFGQTPLGAIRRLRMDKARKLLAETDLTIQKIAEACGYSTLQLPHQRVQESHWHDTDGVSQKGTAASVGCAL
ncbi:HTH-type transcriptional regulator CdhR [Planctomycetes bacterium CA13]|uniref:HTH-type transcriptional regulator CdhR n=1 Tax=Novipirellula herctigrandis TaxID=2527986 RepID=A0A5C5Z8V9_9BACT|nr:HTH-type transcriptional regulator CdhR [Planctomycetes bacterium CA13]